MTFSPIDLRNRLITYSGSGHAVPVAKSFEEIASSDASFIVGSFDFSDDESVHADHWEIHPSGDEILCVLEGRLAAEIDVDGAIRGAVVGAGQALIVPRATWHRLQVLEPGRLIVFTPRAETELRPHGERGRSQSNEGSHA